MPELTPNSIQLLFEQLSKDSLNQGKFVREYDRIVWGHKNLSHKEIAEMCSIQWPEDAGYIYAGSKIISFDSNSTTLQVPLETSDREKTIQIAKGIVAESDTTVDPKVEVPISSFRNLY